MLLERLAGRFRSASVIDNIGAPDGIRTTTFASEDWVRSVFSKACGSIQELML
jgi:hypothetical protein